MAPLQSLRAHPLGLLAIGLGGVAWSIFLLRLTPRRLAGVELDWKDASVIAFHGFVGAALVVAVDRAVLPWLAGVIGARWPDAPEHLALDAFLWAVLLGAAALHQRSPVTYGRAMGVLSLWALLLSVSAALALGVAGSVSAAGGQLPG